MRCVMETTTYEVELVASIYATLKLLRYVVEEVIGQLCNEAIMNT